MASGRISRRSLVSVASAGTDLDQINLERLPQLPHLLRLHPEPKASAPSSALTRDRTHLGDVPARNLEDLVSREPDIVEAKGSSEDQVRLADLPRCARILHLLVLRVVVRVTLEVRRREAERDVVGCDEVLRVRLEERGR